MPTRTRHVPSPTGKGCRSRSKARTRGWPAAGTTSVRTTSSPGRTARDRAVISMTAASAKASTILVLRRPPLSRRGDVAAAGADAVLLENLPRACRGAPGLHADAVELIVGAVGGRVAENVLAVELLGDTRRRVRKVRRPADDF